MPLPKPATIDEYISGFPEGTKYALQQVRDTIRTAAPDAEETISYAIPCFKLHGKYLLYFAGYKHHIGLYPVPTENEAFKADCGAYKTSGKGTLQLPLDQPLPLGLITRIVQFKAAGIAETVPQKAGKPSIPR